MNYIRVWIYHTIGNWQFTIRNLIQSRFSFQHWGRIILKREVLLLQGCLIKKLMFTDFFTLVRKPELFNVTISDFINLNSRMLLKLNWELLALLCWLIECEENLKWCCCLNPLWKSIINTLKFTKSMEFNVCLLKICQLWTK